jgi:superfamily II DNA or RNA helicase
LYGQRSATVYAPINSQVCLVADSDLRPVETRGWLPAQVDWRTHACQLARLCAEGEALIAATAHVRLLPHQAAILERALAMDSVRLAICCEVGLGKTTTAGAIVSELLLRGRLRRVLVVAPKGVQLQWVAEMSDKFGLDFTRLGPEGVAIDTPEVWRAFDLVVTSPDAVKPLRQRAGWDKERVAAYNTARFAAVVAAGWDLIVIDEAHHVAGSSADVARHQLADSLCSAVANVLLLTATPHSGKSDAFRRFLALVDPDYGQGKPVTSVSIPKIVARTVKRTAVDHDGRPLFRGRETVLETVPWGDAHTHHELYEAVTDWVRDGYQEAVAKGDRAGGFLLLLFQRLVASSTAALVATLERRRHALLHPRPQRREPDQDALDLDDEEAEDLLPALRPGAGELAEVERLLALARRALGSAPDPKTRHFLKFLQQLQRDEGDPHVKVLVFTQFRGTQEMLVDLLEGVGIECTAINGGMGLHERRDAQAEFAGPARILVSTDAGGEGVNLQFAHVVVNWDLPWSPTRLEQRIGRIDRIGQGHDVKAVNLVLEDSVEQRVVQVLDEKLAVILDELGVDKRADILEGASTLAEQLFVAAIVDPQTFDDAAASYSSGLREAVAEEADSSVLLAGAAVAAAPRKASALPALAKRIRTLAMDLMLVGEPLGLALNDGAEIAPGEPAPLVAAAEPGWLFLYRVTAEEGASAFAVHRSPAGRIDPVKGDRIWTDLVGTGAKVVGTLDVPGEVFASAISGATDYAYRTLTQAAGPEPHLPRAYPCLIVALTEEVGP